MHIEGYEGGPLTAGEALVGLPGFWSNHLLGSCGHGADGERPVPQWFGDDGADADALEEVLMAPDLWPVFRIPVAGGHAVAIVQRNCADDYGVDHLVTHRDRPDAHPVEEASVTWAELVRVADSPDPAAEGIQDPAARLLLLLPLLGGHALPDDAAATVGDALISVGVPPDSARTTARHLLAHAARTPWHDPTWDSPLSGGSDSAAPGGHGVLVTLGII
ncbi:hypothetical protein ACFYXS_22955 [Streptomyces sp. NPDC002574]|uniref:hypothetical protein n=1 Tax=Streptomyces sp. NPDC002574 TaxID=3364652 RepID=UPI0036779AAC